MKADVRKKWLASGFKVRFYAFQLGENVNSFEGSKSLPNLLDVYGENVSPSICTGLFFWSSLIRGCAPFNLNSPSGSHSATSRSSRYERGFCVEFLGFDVFEVDLLINSFFCWVMLLP